MKSVGSNMMRKIMGGSYESPQIEKCMRSEASQRTTEVERYKILVLKSTFIYNHNIHFD